MLYASKQNWWSVWALAPRLKLLCTCYNLISQTPARSYRLVARNQPGSPCRHTPRTAPEAKRKHQHTVEAKCKPEGRPGNHSACGLPPVIPRARVAEEFFVRGRRATETASRQQQALGACRCRRSIHSFGRPLAHRAPATATATTTSELKRQR